MSSASNWVAPMFGTTTMLFVLILLAFAGGTAMYAKRDKLDPGTRQCLYWLAMFVGILTLLYIVPVCITIVYLHQSCRTRNS